MTTPDQGLLEIEIMAGVIVRTAMMMIDKRGVRSEEIVSVSVIITPWYA